MRHILTSFLTLHWAMVFALLAFVCVDGSHGVGVVFGMLGATVPDGLLADFERFSVAVPLACTFLIVAVLFAWAFVEVFVAGDERPQDADGIIRIAFISAAGALLLVLIGGTAEGVEGLFLVVVAHLTAIMTSYLAMLGERRYVMADAPPAVSDIQSVARAMAKSAARNSMLARISGRTDASSGGAL